MDAAARGEATEDARTTAALAHCAVEVHLDRVSLDAATDTGATCARSPCNPASYKAASVGRHLVTGDPLPVNGYF